MSSAGCYPAPREGLAGWKAQTKTDLPAAPRFDRITMKYTRKSLAKKLGIGIETLRYYENQKLIPPPARDTNGYRMYTEEDANRINHIIVSKKYGFSLKELKTLFAATQKKSFSRKELIPLFQNKIHALDDQIKELRSLKKALQKLIQTI
jgi:DNA-binding transcriptional MerR regulator